MHKLLHTLSPPKMHAARARKHARTPGKPMPFLPIRPSPLPPPPSPPPLIPPPTRSFVELHTSQMAHTSLSQKPSSLFNTHTSTPAGPPPCREEGVTKSSREGVTASSYTLSSQFWMSSSRKWQELEYRSSASLVPQACLQQISQPQLHALDRGPAAALRASGRPPMNALHQGNSCSWRAQRVRAHHTYT